MDVETVPWGVERKKMMPWGAECKAMVPWGVECKETMTALVER
jgi:hypothetical protein